MYGAVTRALAAAELLKNERRVVIENFPKHSGGQRARLKLHEDDAI